MINPILFGGGRRCCCRRCHSGNRESNRSFEDSSNRRNAVNVAKAEVCRSGNAFVDIIVDNVPIEVETV